MPPLQRDPLSSPPVWICPICQKLMRLETIEVANGEERTRRCPTYLLNIAKRSLPELILSGVGLASNDAVG
jgi:hypothetical protein